MVGVRGEELDSDLLIRAIAAHVGMVGRPGTFGPEAYAIATTARSAGDVEALVISLQAVAWFERLRLDNDRALRLLDEAVVVARRAALPRRLGEVLTSRAAVNLELGRIAAARRDLDRADSLLTGRVEPELELKRGLLLSKIGNLAGAVQAYRQVLANPKAAVDLRSRAANNLALDEVVLGHPREALHYIEVATDLAEVVGPALVALVAQNRGLILMQCGRLTAGLRQSERAIVLLAEAGMPLGEAYSELAEILAVLRVLPEARELAGQAARELEAHQVPLMAVEARLKVAELALLMGDDQVAQEAASRAAVELRHQRRPTWAALATVVATEARWSAGSLEPAHLDRTRRAADTLARSGQVSAAVRADLVVGRAARALGREGLARRRLLAAYRRSRSRGTPVLVRVQGWHAAALAAELDGDERLTLVRCRAGLAELAAHRSALASMELRALAAGHGVELGLIGLGLLLRTGSPTRVLDWAERIRAAALLSVEPPAPDDIQEERAELAAVHTELAAARRETGTEPPALMTRQTALEHRIRRAAWHRIPTREAPVAAVRSGRLAALLDDRVLISYGRYEEEMYAVVLDGRRRRLVRLGSWAEVRFEADALQFALRRLTRPGPSVSLRSNRTSADHSLARLAELLVAPAGVDPDAPLVVIPARDTHRVPWSALHRGPVSVAPSASLWAATRARPAGAGNVVVVAGPGLPGAEAEAAAVAAAHRDPVVLTPPRSTPEAVLDAIAGADLVHLACHGRLRADNPTFSSLEVTDGQLTVHELDLRGIAPRRVVLAACDSAADVAYAGDELVGFVGALLARGTAGLVASVVAVADTEAATLIGALHERIAAGDTLAAALHSARSRIGRDDPRTFVNWCTFTAYGAG